MRRKYQKSLRTLVLTMSAVAMLMPVGVNASGEDPKQAQIGKEMEEKSEEEKKDPQSDPKKDMKEVMDGGEEKNPVSDTSPEPAEVKDEKDAENPAETESEDPVKADSGEKLVGEDSDGPEEEPQEEKSEKAELKEEEECQNPEEPESGEAKEAEKIEETEIENNLEENVPKDTSPMEPAGITADEQTDETGAESRSTAENPKEPEKDKAGNVNEKLPAKEADKTKELTDSTEKAADKKQKDDAADLKTQVESKKPEAKPDPTTSLQTVPKEEPKEIQKVVVLQTPQKGEKPDAGMMRNPSAVTEQPEKIAGRNTEESAQQSAIKDTKNPVITISGAKDRSSNRRPLQISVDFQDENLKEDSTYAYLTATNSGKRIEGVRKDSSSAGTAFEFPKISEDDYYVLTAGCSDTNGNETVRKISFTENQRGTVTALKNVSLKDRAVSRKEVSPEFHVSGVDEVTEAVADVNGKRVPVRFNKEGNLVLSSPLTKEGDYTVRIHTKDASGNEVSSEPVSFAIDRTKPKISMKKKESAAEDINTDGKGTDIVISKDQPEDTFTEILVDGRKIEKDEYTTLKNGNVHLNVPGKGAHTVWVTAEDEAGNKETSNLTFSADTAGKKSRSGVPVAAGIVFAAGSASAGGALYIRRKKICRK